MRPGNWTVLGLLIGTAFAAHAGARVEVRDETGEKRYTNFDWRGGTPARRPAVQDHIVAVVEAALQAKGLRRVRGKAEVYVATHVLVERHALTELDDADEWEYWIGVSSVDAFDLRAGTLVVDFFDADQNRRVWRGVGSAAVKGSVDKNLKIIDKIVHKMLVDFMPL
jgi:hypothetical protein